MPRTPGTGSRRGRARARRRLGLAGVIVLAGATFAACGGGGGGGTDAASTQPTTAATTTTTTAPVTTTQPRPTNIYEFTQAGMMSPAVTGDLSRVYVPNGGSNSVSVIDPTTYQVINTFSVGALPQHVVPAYDLSVLYVNNNQGNSLTPIDPKTGMPGASIPVNDPYNLYFTPDGKYAVVMAERESQVDFRDPHTWKLVKSVPIAHRGVNHADFTADGAFMIASCEFTGWVVKIDLATLAVVGEANLGGQPIDVKLSPDATVMYVANQSRDGVSILDPNNMTELGFIPTGAGAHGLYVEPRHDEALRHQPQGGDGLGDRLRDAPDRRDVDDPGRWQPRHGWRVGGRQGVLGHRALQLGRVRVRHHDRPAHPQDPGRQRPPRARGVPPARPLQPRPHRRLPVSR